jgi:hypothetical protein
VTLARWQGKAGQQSAGESAAERNGDDVHGVSLVLFMCNEKDGRSAANGVFEMETCLAVMPGWRSVPPGRASSGDCAQSPGEGLNRNENYYYYSVEL